MKFITYIKTIARYWRMAKDPRTPKIVRWLIYTGLIYTISPVDLIPDFVPGLGLIDDAAVLPSLIAVAMMLIPKEVKREHDQLEKAAIKENKADAHITAEIKEKGDSPPATRQIVAESKDKGYLA